jgi:hypothetical protein
VHVSGEGKHSRGSDLDLLCPDKSTEYPTSQGGSEAAILFDRSSDHAEALYAAFRGLRKKASAGMDGVTYQEFEKDAAGNIQKLH